MSSTVRLPDGPLEITQARELLRSAGLETKIEAGRLSVQYIPDGGWITLYSKDDVAWALSVKHGL